MFHIVRPKRRYVDGGGGGGGATTTLDSGFVGPGAVLSNGNLTVTSSGGNNTERSLASHTSGKYYCEFTAGAVGNTIWGVCGATQSDTNYIGQTNEAFGWVGSWLGGNGGAASGPPQVVGHTYGMCVDVDNGALYLKDITAAGNWNNDPTADPTANTGGRLFSAQAATGGVHVAITVGASGDSTTFNFGGSPYAESPPPTYNNW